MGPNRSRDAGWTRSWVVMGVLQLLGPRQMGLYGAVARGHQVVRDATLRIHRTRVLRPGSLVHAPRPRVLRRGRSPDRTAPSQTNPRERRGVTGRAYFAPRSSRN